MTITAIKYDYPINGASGDTVATLADGRKVTINTQYDCVEPRGHHADDCGIRRMGGRCNCHMIEGIDCAALIQDAIANGKFGRHPKPEIDEATREANRRANEVAENEQYRINRAYDKED